VQLIYSKVPPRAPWDSWRSVPSSSDSERYLDRYTANLLQRSYIRNACRRLKDNFQSGQECEDFAKYCQNKHEEGRFFAEMAWAIEAFFEPLYGYGNPEIEDIRIYSNDEINRAELYVKGMANKTPFEAIFIKDIPERSPF
jgi:hypothetical protein